MLLYSFYNVLRVFQILHFNKWFNAYCFFSEAQLCSISGNKVNNKNQMAPVELDCPAAPACNYKTPDLEADVAIRMLEVHRDTAHNNHAGRKAEKPKRPLLELSGDSVDETGWSLFLLAGHETDWHDTKHSLKSTLMYRFTSRTAYLLRLTKFCSRLMDQICRVKAKTQCSRISSN